MWLLLILYVYLVIHVQCVSSFQYASPGKRVGAKLQQSSSEEDDFHSRAPFLKAMIEAMPVIKERYFFPGHAGGLFAPSELVKVMGEQVFRFDLPELDELDNIHAPEVCDII